jgi:hypothetical protein
MAENYDPNKVSRVVLIDPTASGAAYAATGVGSFNGAVTASAGDLADVASILARIGALNGAAVTDPTTTTATIMQLLKGIVSLLADIKTNTGRIP